MILKRRILDYGLSAVLLAIPALILHSNLKDPDDLNRFDQAVLRVSSPLQRAASWVIEGIGGIFTGYVWLVDVEDENEELRAENRTLREELAATRRRALDAEVLEQMVGLRRRTPADTIGARVISASSNPYFRVSRIRIDRGEDDEIEPGMPVINHQGLVGRVGRVYGTYADVLLTTDPSSSIYVKVQRTGSQGSLRGLGRDKSYACEIEMLERGRDPVEENDLIVTSGLGEFPAGIEVGHVREVTTKDYGLFQEVVVRPTVDFANLEHVIILLAPPPSPDPDGEKRQRSKRAFGVEPY